MDITFLRRFRGIIAAAFILGPALAACAQQQLPSDAGAIAVTVPEYQIGPGDMLQIFVWRNPELSVTVPVRPDGRISVPLIEDLEATRRTPAELAREIEGRLKEYVQNPVVTVIVTNFVGPYSQQVRVVGEATEPQAIAFRENMTLLDVMIAVGGLTEFAAGNRAVIVRRVNGEEQQFRVNIDRLLKDGDMSANVAMLPGDVLIVPQSWF